MSSLRSTGALTDRRTVLRSFAAAGALTLGAPMINLGSSRVFASDTHRYPHRVIDLMRRAFVIDMLAALKLDFTSAAWRGTLSEQDVAMFRSSGVSLLHHSAGLSGPTARQDVMEYLAAWHGFVGRNGSLFQLVNRVRDVEKIKAAGKIAVMMGVQNADHFLAPEDVVTFYELGQRCSQLTYNEQNLIGSGSTERVDGGISDFGARIVEKMNEVGMLVDVSHCGDRTTLDAAELSSQPIAITHSNCRVLSKHPRAKTDEAIRKIAAKGGVMGITGVRMFLRDRDPTTIEDLVDHIDHVVKLTGIEHVGIGTDSDLNGYDDMPADQLKALRAGYKASYAFRDKIDTDGFDDPQRFFHLTEALVRRGYSDSNIIAILGGNFQRLLTTVQR